MKFEFFTTKCWFQLFRTSIKFIKKVLSLKHIFAHSALSFILILSIYGCVAKQSRKEKSGACSDDQEFDPKSRRCVSIKKVPEPPDNTLQTIEMLEDTPLEVALTYTDTNGDFASSCTVNTPLGLGLRLSGACRCTGGFCSVIMTPEENFFGVSDFVYTVTDVDGTSIPTIVRVNVQGEDDPPENDGTFPDTGAIFSEGFQQLYSLFYTDTEGDLATECEIQLSTDKVYVSSPCLCDNNGFCSFVLGGGNYKFTTGPEVFSYRVKAGGQWSEATSVEYKIDNLNNLPIPGIDASSPNYGFASTVIYEGFGRNGTPSAIFTLLYDEKDDPTGSGGQPGTKPASCRLTSNPSVTCANLLDTPEVSCDCGTTNFGECQLIVNVAGAHEDDNKDTSGLSWCLEYELLDGNDPSAGNWVKSGSFSFTVEPVNDPPTLSSDLMNNSPYSGFEDTTIGWASTVTNIMGSNIDVTIDEGGGIDENSQSLQLKITSDNQSIVPDENIKVAWGTNILSKVSGSEWFDVNDGALDASSNVISFSIKPNLNMANSTGSYVTFTVEVRDDGPGSLVNTDVPAYTFQVEFQPGNDIPSIELAHRVCKEKFSAYETDYGCSKKGCISTSEPNFIPSHIGEIFYDYVNDLCYYSADTATALWLPINTSCNFSTSKEEPACQNIDFDGDGNIDNPINCLGQASPVDDSNLVPQNEGTVYYDVLNKKCYISVPDTGGSNNFKWSENTCLNNLSGNENPGGTAPPTPTEQGDIYNYSGGAGCYLAGSTDSKDWINLRCPLSSSDIDNNNGTGLPDEVVTATQQGETYLDTTTGICYVATKATANDWIPLRCPISKKADVSTCPNNNCMGNLHPRGNSSGEEDVEPGAVDRYYLYVDENDSNNSICYRSVGTTINDWVIFGEDIPDLAGNESRPMKNNNVTSNVIVRNFRIDEGGDPTEDSQQIIIRVQNLTNLNNTVYPGNNDLLVMEPENVLAFWSDPAGTPRIKRAVPGAKTNIMGGETLEFELQDAGDASQGRLELQFKTTPGYYGRAELLIAVQDLDTTGLLPPLIKYKYLSLKVYPVSTIHQDWRNLTSVGDRIDFEGTVLTSRSVKITWNAFSMIGNQDSQIPVVDPNQLNLDYDGVQIGSYNIYRREGTADFDFTLPLNKAPITIADLSFTDQEGITADVPGPPNAGTTYYYTVRPIDNFHNLVTHSGEKFDTLRVVVPPENMAFVHRWFVNKEICGRINSETDADNNFRCLYSGVGETVPSQVPGGTSYFDFGYDLLVDTYEVGCPFNHVDDEGRECFEWGCVSLEDPSAVTPTNNSDDMVFYSRGNGKCYDYILGTNMWSDINSLYDGGGQLTATQLGKMNKAKLPPMTFVSQENANEICTERGGVSLSFAPSIMGTTSNARLPSRKEQVAYSAWDLDTLTEDLAIESLETGQALNASSKCNSSRADGISSGFSDSDVPASGSDFSITGSASSDIRSIYTGSDFTKSCVSRYGVQDHIGNVKEWLSDRIYCRPQYKGDGFSEPTAFICDGLFPQVGSGVPTTGYPALRGITCPYFAPLDAASIPGNDCDSTYGCLGVTSPVGQITPGDNGVIFYDTANDECYVSTGATNIDWHNITQNGNGKNCPITHSSILADCDSAVNGNSKSCSGTVSPQGAIAPDTIGQFYYDYLNQECYISVSDQASCGLNPVCWTNSNNFFPPININLSSIDIPSLLTTSHHNYRVDDDFFNYWSMDGVKGPCVDADGNEFCDDSPITSWTIEQENFDAGLFAFPLALPVQRDFKIRFPDSTVNSYLLDIGPSSGITESQLHDDFFGVKSDVIAGQDSQGCGAMTYGGSYTTGIGAGRYTAEYYPCQDDLLTDPVDSHISNEIGFRCVIPIPETMYSD